MTQWRNSLLQVNRLVLTTLLAAFVLTSSDYAVGVAARRFFPEPPLVLPEFTASSGVDVFWRLTESGQTPIVFTGSSMMQDAVSPILLDSELQALAGLEVRSVNLSVPTADVHFSRQLIENFLLPSGVKTVIYGVEMRAITEGPATMVYESPLGYAVNLPPGVEQTLILWLLRHSAFMQYRENLRQLIHGYRPLETTMIPGQNPGYATQSGHKSADFGIAPLGLNVQQSFSSAAVSELGAIAAACSLHNVECIVVNMPIYHAFFEKIPAADEAQYEAILKSEIVDAHIPMWDFNTGACRTYFGDDGFFDVLHLNTAGSQQFTAMIAMLYSQRLTGQLLPLDAPANCAKVY